MFDIDGNLVSSSFKASVFGVHGLGWHTPLVSTSGIAQLKEVRKRNLSSCQLDEQFVVRKSRIYNNYIKISSIIKIQYLPSKTTVELYQGDIYIYLGVSKNNGTPRSSISIRFSMINHPFWRVLPLFLETPIYTCKILSDYINISSEISPLQTLNSGSTSSRFIFGGPHCVWVGNLRRVLHGRCGVSGVTLV